MKNRVKSNALAGLMPRLLYTLSDQGNSNRARILADLE
jgi:hypothetical protein